jgi:phage terminase small subunit
MQDLTVKQEAFVREYLVDMNATNAAIRAGYSAKGAAEAGSRLLRDVRISEQVDAEKKKRSERTKIDADYVLKSAQEVYNRCMQKTPVYDKTGRETGEYKFEASAANKALEIMGKHVDVKAFIDRKEVSGPGGSPIQVLTAEMSEGELEAAIAKLDEALKAPLR